MAAALLSSNLFFLMIGVFHMEIIDDPQAIDAGGHLAHGFHLKFFQNVADLGFTVESSTQRKRQISLLV